MKKFTSIFLSFLILTSCSVSDAVVSNKRIQKRKYNKGFHISKKSLKKAQKFEVVEQNLAESKSTIQSNEYTKNTALNPSEDVAINQLTASTNTLVVESTIPNKTTSVNSLAKSYNDKDVKRTKPTLMSKLAEKSIKSKIKKAIKKDNSSQKSATDTIIYLLLILLVPFGSTISMYMYEGDWTKRVTVNLLLTFLCGLPGVIHSLVVILGNK